ncbi:MAG TPA: hypothetical protein VFV20_02590 [Candidatus Limnocylindria bacterium]|nr:hypothetical protein [Candidatus Limnocylindria bacterium]
MDLRPVVWDATVVTPRDDRGVTIVLRARYRTLEEICTDGGADTRSLASFTPVRHGRVDHAVRADHAWTEAAFA